MAEYTATVRWQRNEAKFVDNRYSREHEWEFDGGISVGQKFIPSGWVGRWARDLW